MMQSKLIYLYLLLTLKSPAQDSWNKVKYTEALLAQDVGHATGLFWRKINEQFDSDT